jgi:hypothetical protein
MGEYAPAMKGDPLAAVKKGVADPAQAPSIHDLMHQAAEDALTAVRTEERFAISVAYSDEELGQRTEALEEVAAPVVRAAAWGGFYGAPNTKALWPGLVGRLTNGIDRAEKNPAHDVWPLLHLYPAVLVLYATGVGAIAGDRPDLLAPLLARRTVLERNELRPVGLQIHATTPFLNDSIANRLPGRTTRTSASDRVYQATLPAFEALIPGEPAFAHEFDRFEYVLSLMRFDASRGDGDRGWAPGGRFVWRREDGGRVMDEMKVEIEAMGSEWPLLREGLFQGSAERLAAAVEGFEKALQRW